MRTTILSISMFVQWDYRKVGGVKIPYVFIRNVGSMGPPHGGVMEEIRINMPLPDTLFLPPEN